MKKHVLEKCLLTIGFWIIVLLSICSAAPPVYDYTGFPQVVVVSGSNYEMGVQYGLQASSAIVHNLSMFKSNLYKKFGAKTVERDMKVWNYYIDKYDPTLKDWLKGIAEGCRQKGDEVKYLDLIALMVYPSAMWSRPEAPYPAEIKIDTSKEDPKASQLEDQTPDLHSCNSFAATGSATKDGKPVVAITEMVPIEAMNTVILIAFPRDGASFVTITYAGRPSSNSGMNNHGLAWSLTAIWDKEPIWGLPCEAYFHYLNQLARSPQEAIDFLKSTPRAGVTGGIILSDNKGDISVFESNSHHYIIRKPGDLGEPYPFVVMTNHLPSPSMQQHNPKWIGVMGTYARYDTVWEYVKNAAAKNEIDFSFIKNMFASDDWYDSSTKKWHYNEPGSPNVSNNFHNGGSVAQAIYFPSDLTAYFQAGTPSGIGIPAYATGEYVKIEMDKTPDKLTDKFAKTALAIYEDARNIYHRELNMKKGYLTHTLCKTIEENLDQSILKYGQGMNRAAFAYLAKDKNDQLALWAEALTYYAHSQLYAQMAKTTLLKASENRH